MSWKKLPLVYADLCWKQFFGNATLLHNAPCLSVVKSALEIAQICVECFTSLASCSRSCSIHYHFITRTKNTHSTVTVENRARVYTSIVLQRLGYHLLQECPPLFKRSVCNSLGDEILPPCGRSFLQLRIRRPCSSDCRKQSDFMKHLKCSMLESVVTPLISVKLPFETFQMSQLAYSVKLWFDNTPQGMQGTRMDHQKCCLLKS
jgi:hypothetical protein